MKRRIKAGTIMRDIRSGLTDEELMSKYDLRPGSLQKLFKNLVDSKVVTHAELCQRSDLYRETTEQIKRRRSPRAGLSIRLPIYDLGSGSYGIVRDISETGLRVAGIISSVGETKTFQLPIDKFMNADPLLFMAKCRWVTEKGNKKNYSLAGFELMNLSEEDLNSLRDFVNFLLLNKSGQWEATS
ncbi:MAG TPA: PilZ domain-containing protein [Desulfomonilaceae bacterium]|nr:PilZ domain-containing protein [Desulfomonilaceae bacterium]